MADFLDENEIASRSCFSRLKLPTTLRAPPKQRMEIHTAMK
jgi:hypothetical protein